MLMLSYLTCTMRDELRGRATQPLISGADLRSIADFRQLQSITCAMLSFVAYLAPSNLSQLAQLEKHSLFFVCHAVNKDTQVQ